MRLLGIFAADDRRLYTISHDVTGGECPLLEYEAIVCMESAKVTHRSGKIVKGEYQFRTSPAIIPQPADVSHWVYSQPVSVGDTFHFTGDHQEWVFVVLEV